MRDHRLLAMSGDAPKVAKNAVKKPSVPAAHPKYTEMVVTAITELKERGGSSRVAILKYVLANYPVRQDPAIVNGHVKHAVRTLIEAGTVKHAKPANTGVTGRFRLGDKKPKAASAKAKITESADSKAVTKPPTKPKSPKTAKPKTATPKQSPTKVEAEVVKATKKPARATPKEPAKTTPKKPAKTTPKKPAKRSPKKAAKTSPKKAVKKNRERS